MENVKRGTYDMKEAAVLLGISVQLGYDLANRGELPGVMRLGSRIVISKKALDAYLEGGEQPP